MSERPMHYNDTQYLDLLNTIEFNISDEAPQFKLLKYLLEELGVRNHIFLFQEIDAGNIKFHPTAYHDGFTRAVAKKFADIIVKAYNLYANEFGHDYAVKSLRNLSMNYNM